MPFKRFRESLLAKLILFGGVTLLLCVLLWTSFNVYYFERNVVSNAMEDVELVSDTIKLALHYAMMLDSKGDIKENINNISQQEDIRGIRVYNKSGEIIFSNIPKEVGTVIGVESPSCWTCHQYTPVPPTMPLPKRTRMLEANGEKLMSIMTPIPNSKGCSPVHATSITRTKKCWACSM